MDKARGYYESWLTSILSHRLVTFVLEHDRGIVTGAGGPFRLAPGLVRIPALAFVPWERFPHRELPAEPIPDLASDLAVEVLSKSNTDAEMVRKLHDYFDAGVRLVWYADPDTRTVSVYTSPTDTRILSESDTLDGEAVLPGFQLLIGDWFAVAGKRKDGASAG